MSKKHETTARETQHGPESRSRAKLSGKLELSWTNKDKALLAHEDGSYEWVPKRDRRVAEVRLLRDAGTVGETSCTERRAADNLLIRGDALYALTALNELPAFAEQYRGKVKLCYIDPPFNTGQTFEQYDDGLEHSVWLAMMRDRLAQIHSLLRADGSVWVHLDDAEMHRCRLLLDEEFGHENFVATIVWQKLTTRENRTLISTSQDYVLVYAKDRSSWARNMLPFGPEQLARFKNPDNDERGPWASLPMHAKAGPGRRRSQFFTVVTPSGRKVDPPAGRCWLYTEDRYRELVAEGRIWFGDDGRNVPRVKTYLAELEQGLVPHTWWTKDEVGDTSEAKAEMGALFPGVNPFATPKPERLMERIIQIATNPGDIVLDCFAGSGTTAAVAHKMGRRWVTVERARDTIDTFTAPRLGKVVAGHDAGGITESIGWSGGGGFRVLDIAPSMYAEDAGVVVLADWATNGELAEAVAAQLGFTHEPDGPFAGRKGRMRLAVLDGHANADVARTLVELLNRGERLTLCATSLDPEVGDMLRRLRSGSRVRVVPEDILVAYATASSWRVSVADELEVLAGDGAEDATKATAFKDEAEEAIA